MALYWQARQALQAVHDHAHRPEHDDREVQEDHRGFAVQVMERVVLPDPASRRWPQGAGP